MENKDMEKKIINKDEMAQIVGGFEYDGVLKWLNGYNVKCPTCGNEEEASIKKRYATGLHIFYTCEKCGQKFNLTESYRKGQILVNKE